MRISVVSSEGALPVWRDTREGLLEPGHILYGDAAWVDEVRRRRGRKLDMARLVRERCILDLAIICFGALCGVLELMDGAVDLLLSRNKLYSYDNFARLNPATIQK